MRSEGYSVILSVCLSVTTFFATTCNKAAKKRCLDASGQLTSGETSLEETQTNIYHPAQHKHDIINSSQCPFSPLLLHGSLYSVCVGESDTM